MSELEELTVRVEQTRPFVERVRQEVGKVILGQGELLDRLLIGLLTNGHVLVEGVPGLAKSLTVATLARVLDLDFRRIQFTPDLLPADLIGTLIFRPDTGEFQPRKGPLFGQLILADEINRAPPKVQSALLEAMQERQVTIGEQSFALPSPFLVLATQNPLEQEGTYPLPEAEVDRFLLKTSLGYPDPKAECEMLRRHGRSESAVEVEVVATAEEVKAARMVVDDLYVDTKIMEYVLSLVAATRDPARVGLEGIASCIRCGVSPRGSLALLSSARGHAFLAGRAFVTPFDVKQVCGDVLGFRLVLSYEAEARELDGLDLVQEIVQQVEVP